MFLEIEKNSVYIHPNITLQVIVQLDLWPQENLDAAISMHSFHKLSHVLTWFYLTCIILDE